MYVEQGNNLSRVKVTNQSAIRKIIYHYGPVLRTEIANNLALTLPTITTNINSMIKNGIIQEVSDSESIPNQIGRRANPVDIIDDAKYFIGVDIHVEFRYYCITNYRGKVIYSLSDDVFIPDYDESIDKISKIITQLISSNKVPIEKISGIGISIPGVVNREEGKLYAHNQYRWFDKHVREDLVRQIPYDIPVAVDNNACAKAYGAHLFNHKSLNSAHSYAYLFVSKGISCPLIINNSNFRSFPMGPGELGYMIMDSTKPRKKYGHSGSLSALAGERALIDQCSEALIQGKLPFLESICGRDTRPTMAQIMKAQEAGEIEINKIIKTAIQYLAIAIANVENFVRPDSFIIDGLIFSNPSNRNLFIETVRANTVRPTSFAANFIFIDYDELNGAIGAAAIAIQAELDDYIE